jgi:outer membrane lipoprotein LolB
VTLSRLQDWKLQGVIGIRTAQETLSASLNWDQQGQNYTIALFGPLGTYSFSLVGIPHRVQLTLSDGRHFIAKNPETLLMEQAGWRLPVSNLYYWIRGLPTPNSAARYHFDAFQRLIQLEQANWSIHYLRYASFNGIDLPTKIILDHPGIDVKIVISQWNTHN